MYECAQTLESNTLPDGLVHLMHSKFAMSEQMSNVPSLCAYAGHTDEAILCHESCIYPLHLPIISSKLFVALRLIWLVECFQAVADSRTLSMTSSGCSLYHAVATGDHLACSDPKPDSSNSRFRPQLDTVTAFHIIHFSGRFKPQPLALLPSIKSDRSAGGCGDVEEPEPCRESG